MFCSNDARCLFSSLRSILFAEYSTKAKKAKKAPPPPTFVTTTHQAENQRTIKVYRFDGILGKYSPPRMQTYDVDTSKCGPQTLDLLLLLKKMDPTLNFRRSCREGICGSCGVLVNGFTVLSCIYKIPSGKVVTILPLAHMYVIRDLVVDMTHFYNGYNSVRPYLIRKTPLKIGQYMLAQSPGDNDKLVGLYECVLCACCSTSCPSYWWNGRRFLGPSALLHTYRWVIDSRDEDTERRLRQCTDDFRLYRCHTIFNCTVVCPKLLNPAFAIARLKLLVAGVTKKSPSEMDPYKFKGLGKQLKEGCKVDK